MIPSTYVDARRRIAARVLGAAVLLGSLPARAEPSPRDPVAAEVLFRAGRDLIAEGNYVEGCPKFEASFALNPSTGTLLNIARCNERDGKIATAWANYTRALVLNQETQGEERRRTLEGIAKQGIDALAPRLPKLRVVVRAPPAGLTVMRDGKELPAAALGEALPADPSQHQVSASAPGYRAEQRSVTLEEGKTTVVEFELQKAAGQAAEVQPNARGWSRPTGIALLSVGALGLSVGAVTGVLSLNKVSALRSSCPDYPHCPPDDTEGQADLRSAKTLGNVSTAGFIAGGVLAATGVALLAIGPGGKRKPESPADRASSSAGGVRISLGPGRFDIKGRF